MYKKILENLRKSEDRNEFKKESRRSSFRKQPHFIFSAENPYHEASLDMDHDKVMDYLKRRGYEAEEMKGKYANEERSIIIHNPPKYSIRHLQNLAAALGQDSSIVSDGINHEMHYHHGKNKGKHHKGSGTLLHDRVPEDFYSTLSDGTHFTHNFDFDTFHESDKSDYKNLSNKLVKSEQNKLNKPPYLPYNPKHELHSGKDVKLIHFSPHKGLTEIDPSHQGARDLGERKRRGEHPFSFFYLDNTPSHTSENQTVLGGSRSKYVVNLGNKKVYDIGTDPDNLYAKAKDVANRRQINPGFVQRDDMYQQIKDAGYHGFINPKQGDPTMSRVVAIFDKMPIHEEYDFHPEDLKHYTSKNHHEHDAGMSRATEHANEEGHHNPKFLHNLSSEFNK